MTGAILRGNVEGLQLNLHSAKLNADLSNANCHPHCSVRFWLNKPAFVDTGNHVALPGAFCLQPVASCLWGREQAEWLMLCLHCV